MGNFKDNLDSILKDLSFHKREKTALFEYYINKRLNESLSTYYSTLNKSINYLQYKDEKKVLKNINKED